MLVPTIETDYLVMGAGASAMGFVDTLLDESQADVVIVDRHACPGGHWNDAYPFVRLHQPSAFYGVNSRELGSATIDTGGLNKGLRELACGAEILSYFEQIMRQRFLASGRVRYFPMSDYTSDAQGCHQMTSLLSGQVQTISVRRKMVDTTHIGTAVPSTHPPQYHVASSVPCIPPNQLPNIKGPYSQYVVVGAGKTGMDTCTWLLQNNVPASRICWIMPRDAWLLDRANVQPDPAFFRQFIGALKNQFQAMAAATSVPDLFARLEASGVLLRLDKTVTPTMYHCATVSQAELAELRRIGNVVREGRVKSIEPGKIDLERGTVSIDQNVLIIDCSARGISSLPDLPVFDGTTINLMLVQICRPALSAALIGYVESHFADDAEKNDLCGVVPIPMVPTDWLRMWAAALGNRRRWSKHEGLSKWLACSRLDGMAAIVNSVRDEEKDKQMLLEEYRRQVGPALENLPHLLAQIQ